MHELYWLYTHEVQKKGEWQIVISHVVFITLLLLPILLGHFHYKMKKVLVLLSADLVLQTALLICTVAKDIYEFLASDSVK